MYPGLPFQGVPQSVDAKRNIKLINYPSLHFSLFGIDGDVPLYEGFYIPGDTWNGWSRPYLRASEGGNLLEVFNDNLMAGQQPNEIKEDGFLYSWFDGDGQDAILCPRVTVLWDGDYYDCFDFTKTGLIWQSWNVSEF